MRQIQLTGSLEERRIAGGSGYFIVRLTDESAESVASLVAAVSDTGIPMRVDMSGGSLVFCRLQQNECTAVLQDGREILISASAYYLQTIARLLLGLTLGVNDREHPAHIHLDTYMSSPGTGLSDVVFQRDQLP